LIDLTIGCNFDFVNKISGSPCTIESGEAGLVVVPSKNGGDFICTPFDEDNATFAIRCCADEQASHITTSSSTCEELGFPVASLAARPDICGTSSINGECATSTNYSQAKTFCEDAGARLCTYGELVSEAGKQTGCVRWQARTSLTCRLTYHAVDAAWMRLPFGAQTNVIVATSTIELYMRSHLVSANAFAKISLQQVRQIHDKGT
jgi:hypothetical protein